MTSKPVAFLLADLGVTKTPLPARTSRNDNPYSESQFKTLKYRPDFPDRFGSIEDARAFCQRFFRWYNAEHRHSGIGFHTPADVHYGQAEHVRDAARRGPRPPPTPRTPNASSASHPNRPRCPPPRGSTSRRRTPLRHSDSRRNLPQKG